MKKTLLFLSVAFISLGIYSQKGIGSREKIKAYKIAYITEQLELNTAEAEKFWPLYNKHQEAIDNFKKQKRQVVKSLREAAQNSKNLDDQKSGVLLDNYIKAEKMKHASQEEFLQKLKTVLSAEKVLLLIKAESDFNKRILEKIKERKTKR